MSGADSVAESGNRCLDGRGRVGSHRAYLGSVLVRAAAPGASSRAPEVSAQT